MSGHLDGKIQIRNQITFVLLQTLEQKKFGIFSIVLLNNKNLATGSADGKIIFWKK